LVARAIVAYRIRRSASARRRRNWNCDPAEERTVKYYRTRTGIQPFKEWRDDVNDKTTKSAIDARISRLRCGNFGKSEPIGEGASESKIDLGPGYRTYYGTDGATIILLHGGDKSTQESDIELAKRFWKDYKARKKQRI
jgi:putative addiction module killer protein